MFNGNTDENAVIVRKNLNASVLYLIMYEVFERRKAMTEIKVSVIVPVYNAEKNLETCLESIVHQTLPDIEIIIVDDGSNDSSRDILKKYADSDERISLIFQNNQYLPCTYSIRRDLLPKKECFALTDVQRDAFKLRNRW